MSGLLALAREQERVRIGWQTRTAPAWEFDLDAIRAAADELGVRGRIEVGCAEYPTGRWGGMYSYESGVHRIRIRRAHSPREASRTLWHELTHALQQTRGELDAIVRAQRVSPRSAAYDRQPHEVEAIANEHRGDTTPLVRA